jgi:glutamyl-tRNA reductase
VHEASKTIFARIKIWKKKFMHGHGHKSLLNFYVAGLNYRKTDVAIRSQFAINDHQYASILHRAALLDLNELFILSTCNRTEVYGFASSASQFIDLICAETKGDPQVFRERCYLKKGAEAVEHLFNVAAGLDSQLLGDYEIIGQIKTAVRFSKQHGFIGAFMERLVNCVLQSSKNIKNQTQLSGGTVSVSFAAVQYIREEVKDIASKKILLLGIGKIGRNTGRNLADYLGTRNITFINRSPEKATQLAKELGLKSAPACALHDHLDASDIIIVATNAQQPVVRAADIRPGSSKLFIDLSIPCNVEAAVAHVAGATLVNVDQLSGLKDATLRQREAEVPRAKEIIAEHIREFNEWYEMRRHVPVLKAVKTKLREIHSDPLFLPLYTFSQNSTATDQKIQRVINGMASKMKTENQKGCHYIEAINEFIGQRI